MTIQYTAISGLKNALAALVILAGATTALRASDNTATGTSALSSTTSGIGNTADGYTALRSDNTGSYNSALGRNALFYDTSGSYNIGIGVNSLVSNTTGASNIGIGLNALHNNTTSGGSIAIGQSALIYSTGSNNVAIGFNAGSALTTGSNDIYLGSYGVTNESSTMRLGTILQSTTYLFGTLVNIPGLTAMGTGTGTAEMPTGPILVRRINSMDSTTGSVVAISEHLKLERYSDNGNNGGGFQMVYDGDNKQQEVAVMGIDQTASAVNSVFTIAAGSRPSTTILYSGFEGNDNTGPVFFHLTFGDIFDEEGQTIVVLQRQPNDTLWTGTVTSTKNQ